MATKDELLAEAQSQGLDVSDQNTKDEIQAALDAAASGKPQDLSDEEIANLNVAAAHTGAVRAPGRIPESDEARSEREEKEAAVREISNTLADLSFTELTKLRSAVDGALFNKGHEPDAPAGPTLQELASALPINDEATRELSPDEVADKVGVDVTDIIGARVRQARTESGGPVGAAYLSVALADGTKRTARLDD